MPAPNPRLAALRAEIAALEGGARAGAEVIAFGDERLDGRLPGGGLSARGWSWRPARPAPPSSRASPRR